MECKEFKNIVADLFDKEVSLETQKACNEHISHCAECRDYYEDLLATADLLRPKHSPISQKTVAPNSIWMKILCGAKRQSRAAASFIGILLISGMAFAAVHILSPSNTQKSKETSNDSEQKMLTALHDGDAIVAIAVNVCKGTWIQNGDDSYIEEHPTFSFGFRLKSTTVKLDGMEIDVHNLPSLPASALKKLEMGRKDGRGFANLITAPIKIPANLKGNINPELTILLTGVVPANAIIHSSIYVKRGLHKGFDWKEYQYTSWTGQAENVRHYLGEVAIRKDHHVRINICKGVSNKHIDRIKKIMEECNVTNYEIIQP